MLGKCWLLLLWILRELGLFGIFTIYFSNLLFFLFFLLLLEYFCLLLLDNTAKSSDKVPGALLDLWANQSGLFLDLILLCLLLGKGGSTRGSMFHLFFHSSGTLANSVFLSLLFGVGDGLGSTLFDLVWNSCGLLHYFVLLGLFLYEVFAFVDCVCETNMIGRNLDLGSPDSKKLLAHTDEAGTLGYILTATNMQIGLFLVEV